MYQVDDGTGEILVVSQNDRIPSKGARVRVTGKVGEFAVFGGRSIGLHLREGDLDFTRPLTAARRRNAARMRPLRPWLTAAAFFCRPKRGTNRDGNPRDRARHVADQALPASCLPELVKSGTISGSWKHSNTLLHSSKRVNALLGPLGLHVPDYLVFCALIVLIVLAVGLLIRAKLSVDNPSRLQIVLEDITTFIVAQLDAAIGPGKGRKYLALCGGIFVFILIGNLMGQIPGLGVADEQHQRAVRLRASPCGSTTTGRASGRRAR